MTKKFDIYKIFGIEPASKPILPLDRHINAFPKGHTSNNQKENAK